MPETREDRLGRYTIEDAKMLKVGVRHLDDIAELEEEVRNQLKAYHPGLGEYYRVSCRIHGAGPASHLQINLPDPDDDNGWGDAESNRRKLISGLKYVPMPDFETPRQGVLYLSQEIIDSDASKLGNTAWKIVHSRLQKIKLQSEDEHGRPVLTEVNNVIFCWSHPGLTEYVVTDWKW